MYKIDSISKRKKKDSSNAKKVTFTVWRFQESNLEPESDQLLK